MARTMGFLAMPLCALAMFLVMASFDESLTAEAILRLPSISDSRYVVSPRRYKAVIQMNNRHSSCPNGKPSCNYRDKRTGRIRRSRYKVDCHATMIQRDMAVTARHCFCHKGNDIAYNSGFYVWVAGEKIKVKRTWVHSKCPWSCDFPGTRNQCDLAIIELEKKAKHVGLNPLNIYNPAKHGLEVGKSFEMVGYGATGPVDRMSARQCKAGRQDGRLRRATGKIFSLGKWGDSWGSHRNMLLRMKMPLSRGRGRMRVRRAVRGVPGVAGQGDSGIPAMIKVGGRAYLAGVRVARHRNLANLRNPCRSGTVDEFVRLAATSTRSFIKHVVDGTTMAQDATFLHRARFLDVLPLKKPGSYQFPWHHQFGHRRRAVLRKKDSVPYMVAGQNKCRRSVNTFLAPYMRNLNLELCGMTPDYNYPLEFLQPGFLKKLQPVLYVQNRDPHWNYHKDRLKRHLPTKKINFARFVSNFRKTIIRQMFENWKHLKKVGLQSMTKTIPKLKRKAQELRMKIGKVEKQISERKLRKFRRKNARHARRFFRDSYGSLSRPFP